MKHLKILSLTLASVVTLSLFSLTGCGQDQIYLKEKTPKLQTFVVPKSDAETRDLNITYKVVK